MTKTLLGCIAPIYCCLLLVGCVYLSNSPFKADTQKTTQQQITLPADPIASFSQLPVPDFKSIKPSKARKHAFFSYFSPIIRAENERLQQLNQKLKQFTVRYSPGFENVSEADFIFYQTLANEFSLDGQIVTLETIEKLKRRVQPLPKAMVLAQAATESAWGTSRFAREGNNYFGQWCFSKNCGIVPKHRKSGARHEVAKFASPAHSVRAYFHNINSFTAYQDLRDIRQSKMIANQPVQAKDLLKGLIRYSERGEDYLHELASIIRQNKLEE